MFIKFINLHTEDLIEEKFFIIRLELYPVIMPAIWIAIIAEYEIVESSDIIQFTKFYYVARFSIEELNHNFIPPIFS